MIEVEITGKRFGPTPVLAPMAFQIARGQTVALVGPSGVGKTTLLHIVAGLDRDFTGRVTRSAPLAMVFQEPTLLPWRSARDNLRIIHPELTEDQAQEALKRVGLGDRAQAFPGQLSLGQQRRLALARAFARPPAFLGMDEPFASLDTETSAQMQDLTATLIAEHKPAALIVTHSMAEARRLGDRILTLRPGPKGAVLSTSPPKVELVADRNNP